MHIRDIEQSLPSGFHDTFLRKITVDYEKKILLFDITVHVENTDNREYLPQKGRLIVKNLSFFSMDPPGTSHMWQDQDSLWISGSGPLDELRKKKKFPALKNNEFSHYFFIDEFNGCIHFIASDAEFFWDIEE